MWLKAGHNVAKRGRMGGTLKVEHTLTLRTPAMILMRVRLGIV
jgi:hypothetical protein